MKYFLLYSHLNQKKEIYVENLNKISSALIAMVLVLLPYERLILPFNTRIVDFVLVLAILYFIFLSGFVHQYIHLPLIWPIWMVLIASLLATVTGMMGSESYLAIIKDIYIFVWFIALCNLLFNLRLDGLNLLMKIWSLIAVVEATTSILGMLGIGPAMFYTPPFYDKALSIGRFNRAIGTFLNPNALAPYLVVSLFVLLVTTWPKSIRLFLAVWILAGIFGTGSMAAMTSTIGGLVILLGVNGFLKTKEIPKFWGFMLLVGLVFVLMIALIFVLFPSILSSSTLAERSDLFMITLGRLPRSFSSRVNLILSAWPIYSRFPLGTGPETYDLLSGELHNDYISYLFERGPLGLIGWLGMVGILLFTSFRSATHQTNDHHRWQLLSFGVGFLACAVISLSHEISHFRQVWVFIAFLLSFSQTLSRKTADTQLSGVVQPFHDKVASQNFRT